jgi:hypothetical protein
MAELDDDLARVAGGEGRRGGQGRRQSHGGRRGNQMSLHGISSRYSFVSGPGIAHPGAATLVDIQQCPCQLLRLAVGQL